MFFRHNWQGWQILAICRKDMESYYSKPPLVTWGVLFPAVLLLALYFKDPAHYLETAPGLMAMILLFGTTSMAAIVITFEQRLGTLQRLLLAPLTLQTIIWGKTLAAAAYGLLSAVILTVGLQLSLGLKIRQPTWLLLGLILGALVFAFLGQTAAALVREVFEAMTLMNFFRFPFLFVSGVITPLPDLPVWLKPLALLSPLTYLVDLLQWGVAGRGFFNHPGWPLAVLVLAGVGSWLLAITVCRRRLFS